MKTRVKELRTQAGMTQQQLADLVRVSSRTIISIEKEQYNPSLMLAYHMAEVFGVSVEELCCLKENKELEDRNMKVYNRKRTLLGGIWMLLALWNLVHDFGSPDPNALVQVRDSILSVFLLLLGITSFGGLSPRRRQGRIKLKNGMSAIV